MLSFTWFKKVATVLGISITIAGSIYFYAVTPHHSSAPPNSAEGLLDAADTLSWGNQWAEARPLYMRAEQLFTYQGKRSKALYARISQIPPDETVSVRQNILKLTEFLATPEARDPETKLRILTVRGMLEVNYDAAQARATWMTVQALALHLHHVQLATRALGEQGIAAFILGDTETAKKQVVRAWGLSKVEHDPAASVRYASVFGAGLVQVHRYKEALGPLNEAIRIAATSHGVAYPTIAVYAKIDALAGLHQYNEALQLANQSLKRLEGTPYAAHRSQVLLSLGGIQKDRGDLKAAIDDYEQAVEISAQIQNYRGITDAGGLLAQVYESTNNLPQALKSINLAIDANTRIPDELYLVPRNLAIKAEITDKMGDAKGSDALYRKSMALIDRMIGRASTTNVQRQLLSEMSDVYSGYFASLCAQKRYDEALQVLENVRGRVETEALLHHANELVHEPNAEEKELTKLNLSLIDTDDPASRAAITSAIYTTELGMSPSSLAQETITHPVHLKALQQSLSPNELVIEYVLAEPASYAFAITQDSVTPYRLSSKAVIESDARQYTKDVRGRQENLSLAAKLFDELLKPIKEYGEKTDLIVIPDGSLHLVPFAALADSGGYVLKTHTVDISPSSTVFDLLTKRVRKDETVSMPYIGVAAWTQTTDNRNPIVRSISGPQRSQLVPLPDSQTEVETIAKDLPQPSTILLGADATEGHFKSLDLNSTEVVHLALHGYTDLDYPDRSALIFAPDASGADDGLLQVREIRNLHLKAKLVTLSACNTGVGPVGEAGIVNLVNAFIEAGADSVVSTLWEVEDHTTEHLMTDFYSELANHKRKVEALRSAQLAMISQGLTPYFWASFQIVGDPNGTL
jgi:CHAT domain-containing protein